MIRFAWELFGMPAVIAGALIWAIFGTYRGAAVQDDFTWFIGAIVFLGGIEFQYRIQKLRDRVDALAKELAALKKGAT